MAFIDKKTLAIWLVGVIINSEFRDGHEDDGSSIVLK